MKIAFFDPSTAGPGKIRGLAALAVVGLLLAPLAALPAEPHAGHGHEAAADSRQAIPLDAREKNFLLGEMREFLVVSQRILAASQAGDMQAVAAAARSVGLKAHRDDFTNPASIVQGIRKKAPQAFLPLGKATHAGFDEIADIAEQIGDKDAVNNLLADNMRRCVACHAGYRLADGH